MSEKNANTLHARVILTLSCVQGHARIRWKTVIDFIIKKGFMECLISKLNLPLPECTRFLGRVSLFQFRFLLFAIQLLYYIVFVNFHFSAFNVLAHFSSVSSSTIATFHKLTSRAWRHDKEWGWSRVGKRKLLIMTSRRRRRREQSYRRRLWRIRCAVIYVTYYQLGMMVLLRHCCWTSVVWTAVGQGGKGSEVLELVQARPSTINTSSGEDKLVRCWTSVWVV